MHHGDLNEIIFQVLIGRMRGDSHSTDLIDCQVIRQLIRCATLGFLASPAILRLSGAFVVVGDIHGNLDDLLRIFERHGYPPDQRYLFLGDFIDRGNHSLEVLLLVYALFVKYPSHVHVIRGNHETRVSAKSHGFSEICLLNLSKKAFRLFLKSFAQMPIAAVLNNRMLCVHGGIASGVHTLAQLEAEIERPIVNVASSCAEDILWSDPLDGVSGFTPSRRGMGCFFGSDQLEGFLDDNGLECLIRAHEWFHEGFDWPFGLGGRCLTVFSSSNYCGKGNRGAVAIVSEDGTIEIVTFEPIGVRGRRLVFPEWLMSEGHPSLELPEIMPTPTDVALHFIQEF
jgi:protein phosphatase